MKIVFKLFLAAGILFASIAAYAVRRPSSRDAPAAMRSFASATYRANSSATAGRRHARPAKRSSNPSTGSVPSTGPPKSRCFLGSAAGDLGRDRNETTIRRPYR